ncbi:uncharacterized protein LOC144331037 [Macaca mulatta]
MLHHQSSFKNKFEIKPLSCPGGAWLSIPGPLEQLSPDPAGVQATLPCRRRARTLTPAGRPASAKRRLYHLCSCCFLLTLSQQCCLSSDSVLIAGVLTLSQQCSLSSDSVLFAGVLTVSQQCCLSSDSVLCAGVLTVSQQCSLSSDSVLFAGVLTLSQQCSLSSDSVLFAGVLTVSQQCCLSSDSVLIAGVLTVSQQCCLSSDSVLIAGVALVGTSDRGAGRVSPRRQSFRVGYRVTASAIGLCFCCWRDGLESERSLLYPNSPKLDFSKVERLELPGPWKSPFLLFKKLLKFDAFSGSTSSRLAAGSTLTCSTVWSLGSSAHPCNQTHGFPHPVLEPHSDSLPAEWVNSTVGFEKRQAWV